MLESVLRLFRYNLCYADALVEDVPDEQMTEQPCQGFNHPAWILGHLVMSCEYTLSLLGIPGQAPAEWHGLYDPGQVPSPERSLYPSKDALLAELGKSHARVEEGMRKADPALLAGENPIDSLRPHMPTLGDLLAHLLTTHEATHLGQLSAWRRQTGLGSLGPIPTLPNG